MALSFAQYPADDVTVTFQVPFPYLARDHISVKVKGVAKSFTWDNAGVVRITGPAPTKPDVVEVRRTTPREEPMVDYQDGSVLTEGDLDLQTLQTFFIVQEAIDIAGGTLELRPDGSYGAGFRRITEVGDPAEDYDAVNKRFFESTFLPQMQALLDATVNARNAGQVAQGSAETARNEAVAARDLAIQYRDTTKAYRDEVAAWNANVNTKSGNVDAKSASVDTKAATVDTQSTQVAADRVAVQGFRNETEGFKNAAAASAAAAATFDPANYYNKTTSDGRFVKLTDTGYARLGTAQTFTVTQTFNPTARQLAVDAKSLFADTAAIIGRSNGSAYGLLGYGTYGVYSNGHAYVSGALGVGSSNADTGTIYAYSGAGQTIYGYNTSGGMGVRGYAVSGPGGHFSSGAGNYGVYGSSAGSYSGYFLGYWGCLGQGSSGIYGISGYGQYSFYGNGEGYASYGFNAPSDARLKENITDAPEKTGLDTINRLRVVEFDWREGSDAHKAGARHQTGLIAQEVREVLPDAVRTITTPVTRSPDAVGPHKPSLNEQLGEFFGLKETTLIFNLIKAVQQLSAKVEALEALRA
jgi:hypothetical protein